MRCRVCGLELDSRDRLRNGAYRCPECGTIHHTAQSSRVSPSPWRRKRRSHFAPAGNVFTQRFFHLPLWSWLAIAVAVIVAVVLLVTFVGRGTPDATGAPDMPATEDLAIVDMTANPVAPEEAPAATDEILQPEATAVTTGTSTSNTGILPSDFMVSFDWAMSYLNYTSSLTTGSTGTGAAGETIQDYSFEDWFTLRMTLDPSSGVIRSATATAQIDGTDETKLRALHGLVSMLYSFDISINAGDALNEVQSMLTGLSASYERDSFSAVASDNGSSYVLTVNGKRQ